MSRLSLSLYGLPRLPAGNPPSDGAAFPGLAAGGVSAAMALRLCLVARFTAGLAGMFVCRVFPSPVMTTKLAAPDAAMEAKGQHPSGASEALLRAVLSIPHHSHLCAASSSPESLRSLASPLLPLNARQSGIRLTASAPQASSSPFIGRELASLPIIPGGYGCKSPPPRSSSLPERRNGVGAIPAALPHARLASCDLEAARKQHGAQPVLSSSAMRDEPDLNNIIINSMPGTSSVRAV